MARTQQGNNNAYCQDNELSWLDWSHLDPIDGTGWSAAAYDPDEEAPDVEELVDFTRRLVRLRLDNPVFRRQRWFAGRPIGHHAAGEEAADIAWFTPAGTEMEDENWEEGWAQGLAVFVNGRALQSRDARGQRITGDSFLLLLNASTDALPFTLPGDSWAPSWAIELDTADPARGPRRGRGPDGSGTDAEAEVKGGDTVTVTGHSLQVLRAGEVSR